MTGKQTLVVLNAVKDLYETEVSFDYICAGRPEGITLPVVLRKAIYRSFDCAACAAPLRMTGEQTLVILNAVKDLYEIVSYDLPAPCGAGRVYHAHRATMPWMVAPSAVAMAM